MQEGSLKRSWFRSGEHWFVAFFVLMVGVASFAIPSLGGRQYASPDERAVAFVATRLASFQSPRLLEPLAVSYPWLHPRSWVSQGGSLVPVGFLGWPFLLAPFAMVFGSWVLPLIGWFLMASTVYPLFWLLRKRFSLSASLVGVMGFLASPMVLLYANRGLFPNVGLLAAALWSVWAFERVRDTGKGAWLAALFCAMACVIRPFELLWLFPWWIWAGGRFSIRRERSVYLAWLLFAAIIVVFLMGNASVYGHWWQIGYWLRDNPLKSTGSVLRGDTASVHLLPFGIHPRSILWNVRSFFLTFLWPSVLIGGTALVVYVRRSRARFSLTSASLRDHSFVLLGLWTMGVLVTVYGSGLYQDHVQVGAVTVANSFLRYLLPLAPLVGVAAAYLYDVFSTKVDRRWIALALLFVTVFGVYSISVRDDEGVFTTRKELRRYEQVLSAAKQVLPEGSIVLSDRSDKMFSGVYRTVSPMPSREEVLRLLQDPSVTLKVGLYARPPSQMDRDAWRAQGIELIDLGVFGREHLYRVSSR